MNFNDATGVSPHEEPNCPVLKARLKMFCPNCGQPQTSDNQRFCSRCGLRLGAVKELLIERGQTGAGAEGESPEESFLPRQRDINTGAALMLIGGIVAALWGFHLGAGAPDLLLAQAFAIVGFVLTGILLLFHPLSRAFHKLFAGEMAQAEHLEKRRGGINLGALLMFVGTLKAFLLASYAHPSGRASAALLFMTFFFLVLLVLRVLLRAVYRLFLRETARASDDAPAEIATSGSTAQLHPPAREAALPPAQSIPVSPAAAPRPGMAEVVQPPSVTEDTTRKLEESH